MRIQFIRRVDKDGETFHNGFDYELDDDVAEKFIKAGEARHNPLASNPARPAAPSRRKTRAPKSSPPKAEPIEQAPPKGE